MSAATDLIELAVTNGQPTTTSLAVAERFGKLHKNVLQSIEGLECSEEFNRLNFQPIARTDDRNRLQPMYAITKDGFMFLAMGFTGKEAAVWKERFIAAFNTMEAALLAQVGQGAAQPRIPAHAADRLVAASRSFNAILRSSRAAGIALPSALRRASVVAERETGINMLAEMQAEDHLAELDQRHNGGQGHPGAVVWPEGVQAFLAAMRSGEMGITFHEPMLTQQLYRFYLRWCRTHRVRFPLNLPRLVYPLNKSGETFDQRKRYRCADGSVIGPNAFVYPVSCERPAHMGETQWLGECVRRADEVLNLKDPTA